jgi:cbb3-type cytochrome oxidase maturation protein
MDALIFLIPAALFLGLLGLAAFMWALRSGQFDDLDGAAMRILNDDELGSVSDEPASSEKPN